MGDGTSHPDDRAADGTGALVRIVLAGAVATALVVAWVIATFIDVTEPRAPQRESLAQLVESVTTAASVMEPRPMPSWIWDAGAPAVDTTVLRRTIAVDEVAGETRAFIRMACDNAARLSIDGVEIGGVEEWSRATEIEARLVPGAHELSVAVRNDGGPAGFVALVELRGRDGSLRWYATDEAWTAGDAPVAVMGEHGVEPWGNVAGLLGPDVERAIEIAPGYAIELVHAVDPEQGSWVAMTADDQGRLIVSAQGGGLFRVTPGDLGAPAADVLVEPIDVPVGQAQGLAWVEGDLYCVTSGDRTIAAGDPDETAAATDEQPVPLVLPQGLYRVRDTDGDDRFDAWEMLRAIPGGGGEHGPHAVVPGPDGKLYVTVGNHIPLIDVEHSAVPPVWQEDQLLPRLWDPRGHAVGIMAPGGWIARFDREGADWDLFSIGFRNAYDMAFDARGELFAYDADMEWDMGTPWYRPTRLVHVVSGSDFGWRSGSGKWPDHAEESLPSVIDLGPGSPTGVVSGVGARLAARHRDALFLLDWTFGTVHVVTLEPDGASYRAERETLIAGRPFPVADAVISPRDGALYLVLGGRGVASAIYRVHAPNGEREVGEPQRPSASLALRRDLERRHGAAPDGRVLDEAWPHLADRDRFVRHAARVAVEHQPIGTWLERALTEPDPRARVTALVAAARCGDGTIATPVIRALAEIDFEALDVQGRLAWLRALALTLIRQGTPDPGAVAALRHDLAGAFPTGEPRVDRELAALLVRLGAPSAVAALLAQMEVAGGAPLAVDETRLGRNDSYGRVIVEMSANPPHLQAMHYGTVLRLAERGWTPQRRERYFRWFESARRAAGGHSYTGFLDRIREDALERIPEPERTRLAALGADPLGREAVPVPDGPGRPWTTDAVAATARNAMRNRDFERGRRMFAAAACNVCHHFGGASAGLGGPDLTTVATRYSARDLAEAIVEPSRVISDQYRFEDFELDDGTTVTGRVIGGSLDDVTFIPSLLAPKLTTTVERSRIVAQRPSPVSPMPPGLIDRLNADELADLLAYLISEGDARSPIFAVVGNE